MKFLFSRVLGAFVFLLSATVSQAEVLPVELEQVRHQNASLVVVGADGENEYNAAQLEALGSYRMVTRTPWRDQETAFDGALLNDVLRENGLDGARAIRVIAENGYATEIEAEVWKNYPILLATRVNGRPHSRRARGPIQFVLPLSDSPEVAADGQMKNWVWMAARIEPVE